MAGAYFGYNLVRLFVNEEDCLDKLSPARAQSPTLDTHIVVGLNASNIQCQIRPLTLEVL